MYKLISIFMSIIFLLACSNHSSKDTRLNSEDYILIQDLIERSKQKLPIKINDKINVIDIYSVNNKLVYVYKVNMIEINEGVIDKMKSNNYSSPKINEICDLILNTFYGPVEVEYKFVNINNLYLFSINFNKEKCENYFNSH